MAQQLENKKRLMVVKVISDKMEKTVVVQVPRDYRHPLFHKVMRSFKQYKVHDADSKARVGDMIEFYEGRPVSKTKCMYLERVITSASN